MTCKLRQQTKHYVCGEDNLNTEDIIGTEFNAVNMSTRKLPSYKAFVDGNFKKKDTVLQSIVLFKC